jgi:circadian clock protein KaiC
MPELTEKAATGVAGLDDILCGGFPRNRIYLIQGDPGVGKTTLALQFLLEGVHRGESCLYITLSETEEEVRAVAASHNWSLEGLAMFELSAVEQQMSLDAENTVFAPSEVELPETTKSMLAQIDRIKPSRVVFDSLSELRLLSQGALRYRRQILALKQFFNGRRATVLLLDDLTSDPGDMQLQSLAHGVLTMQQMAPEYGGDRRRMRVAKLRGLKFRSGYHDFSIETGGLLVYPRLVAAEHHSEFKRGAMSSGLEGIDRLVGGGLTMGTSTLIMGPAGAGKSAVADQFVYAAAMRGERSVIFAFDESRHTLIARADSLGMDFSAQVERGLITIQQVDPAEMGPGELAHRARLYVEDGVKVVVIDSLNGYLHSMPEDKFLYTQLHELLSYFGQRGVMTILVMAQSGMMGQMQGPADITYIADTVVLLRYFEHAGRIRKAISVVKKRTGMHEDTIRELTMGKEGVRVGEALESFHGVLTGVPTYTGGKEKLHST